MDMNLKGRRALVTGSTGGIGYGIAKALAEMGATVAVNGRTPDRVRAAIGRLTEETGTTAFIAAPGDIATASGAEAVVKGLPEVDILVNNTGIFEPKPFFEIPDDDWLRFFEDQRDERHTPLAGLHAGYGRGRMGAGRLHFQRVRA